MKIGKIITALKVTDVKYIEKFYTVNKEIQIEDIGLKITEDSLILAEFIKKSIGNMYGSRNKEILEIGAGQGVISVLLSETVKTEIYAVEIQESICMNLLENIERNNLKNKIFPLNEDIKNIEGEYDIIFSNPPYRKMNSGKLPEKQEELISKYEKSLTLEELFFSIKRLLKNNGHFFVIIPDYRLNDVFSYIYKNNMDILFLEINEYKKKKLVVVHGKKGGKRNSGINIKVRKKV